MVCWLKVHVLEIGAKEKPTRRTINCRDASLPHLKNKIKKVNKGKKIKTIRNQQSTVSKKKIQQVKINRPMRQEVFTKQ